MKTYVVTFESHSDASREKVAERLKTYGYYCPIHNYCWAIMTEKTAMEIVTYLKEVINSGERLFVVRSGTEGAWVNIYGEKNSEWLKKNL